MAKHKEFKIWVLVLACIISLTACDDNVQKVNPPESGNAVTVSPMPTIGPSTQAEDPKTTSMPAELHSLQYYSISSTTGYKEAVTALIPEGETVSPEMILSLVAESMEEQSILIKVDSVKTKGDTVIVNFSQDSAPVVNTTKHMEDEILDAVAQSLLDNLTDYQKVIYQVDGGNYVSDHKVLEKDYVYLEKID